MTKDGYIPYTNSATVTIAKREVTLTSGSGAKQYNGIALTNWTFTVSGDDFVGDVPAGGVSKFDVTCMYDGDGHSVDMNSIVAAFGGSVVGEFTIKFCRAGSMNPPSGDFIEVALPVWTNIITTAESHSRPGTLSVLFVTLTALQPM